MDRHINRKRTARRLGTVALIMGTVLGIMGMGGLYAQDVRVAGTDNGGGEKEFVVGTYEAQRAFQQFPGRAKLIEAYQSSQEDMARAREEGDQQKSQQLQQQLQAKQQQVIEDFEGAVQEALPNIAREAGLKVVVSEVLYSADDVETRDVTPQVIKAIGAATEEGGSQPQPAPRRR